MTNILVIKHGALGDIILAMSAFKAIRDHHPNDKITLMCRKSFIGLGRDCGYFDDVIEETMPKWYQPHHFLKTAAKISTFDHVYDLQNNDRTQIYFSLISKDKRPKWSGVQNGASHQINDPDRNKKHAYTLLEDQLKTDGISIKNYDSLQWMDSDLSSLPLQQKYALIVPGCSPQHPQKRWPKNNFVEIVKWTAQQNIQPVLIGTKDEEDILAHIALACPEALNLCGSTQLYDIPTLGRGAVWAVGNDTGPIHMLALSGCPTLALYQGAGEKWKRSTITGDNTNYLHSEYINDISVESVIEKLSA